MRNFVLGDDPVRIVDNTTTIADRSVVKLTAGQIGIVFDGNIYLRADVIPVKDAQIEKVWDHVPLYEALLNVTMLFPPRYDAYGVDWKSIPIDTKIEIFIGGKWKRAFFAGYAENKPWCFAGGKNSFTAGSEKYSIESENIRLYKKGI